MSPILNKGYTSVGPWPCRERQLGIWKIELRISREVRPAVEHAKQHGRIPEELGEFFFWLASKYAEHSGFDQYINYKDYLGEVVLFMCIHTMNFNTNVNTDVNKYFIHVACHHYKKAVNEDVKQLEILDRVKEEMDIQELEHYYELSY